MSWIDILLFGAMREGPCGVAISVVMPAKARIQRLALLPDLQKLLDFRFTRTACPPFGPPSAFGCCAPRRGNDEPLGFWLE
jgi:hypothetical protein